MKIESMRTYKGSTDLDDIKLIIKELEIDKLDEIFDIRRKFYPNKKLPETTVFMLEEILARSFENDHGMEM